jgi:hypothetical protein
MSHHPLSKPPRNTLQRLIHTTRHTTGIKRMSNRHLKTTTTYGSASCAYEQGAYNPNTAFKDAKNILCNAKWPTHIDREAGPYSQRQQHPCSFTSVPFIHRHLCPPLRNIPISRVVESGVLQQRRHIEVFYSPRQRQERIDAVDKRTWSKLAFDEYSLCLGVHLVGCVVVIVTGAAVVGICIMLHQ